MAGWILANRPLIISCLLRLVWEWRQAGSKPPTKSLDGFHEWSRIVGGVVSWTAGNPDLWLHPDHRPLPKLHLEWRALVDRWPRSEAGFHPLSAGALVPVVDDLGLPLIGARTTSRSSQGRATKMGRLLTELAKSTRPIGTFKMVTASGRNGRLYCPIPVDAEPPTTLTSVGLT